MNNEDSAKCKRCHRVLKDPVARHRGYGEFCWRKYLEEQQQKNSLFPLKISSKKGKG